MRVEGKASHLSVAPPPAPTPPPTEEEEKKRAASKKATSISAGIFFVATGVGAGVSYVLNAFAPRTVGKAVEPVLNTGVGVGQAAGGRFHEQYLNDIRARVFRASTGPGNGDATLSGTRSKVIYPEALATMVDVSNQRNKLNGQVSGMSDNFALQTSMLALSCEAAAKRIAAGDTHGAVRHLAGALAHDHNIWLEHSPKSEHTFARLYRQLYPYFHKLPKAEIEAFREAVSAEAERITGGKRPGLAAYVDAVVKGLTRPSPQKQIKHPLLLQAPGEPATVSLESIGMRAANDETGDTEIRKALDEHFTKLMEGKTWLQRFTIRRTQKRVTKLVLKAVHAKMERNGGKPLSMEELWTVVQDQLNSDVSRRVENKITAISFGAFAGVGAASSVGKFYLERALSPQIMLGLEAVVFTLVGIAMGTAGSFFQDRFNNIARAFGYGGLERVTMGPSVERELLDNLLRTWTVDGRVLGGRYAYLWYSRLIHETALDAESAIKAGDLETAADFLAGVSSYGRTMFFSFSPLMEAFEILFNKLGPHFDCCTDPQRNELIHMVQERLKANGATAKEMAIYHQPFIEGLLLTNVEPRKA